MGLVLRKNLTEPLTHSQLDGNFEFLQISEWTAQNYEKGKLVYIVDPVLNNLATYMCIRTHNALLYLNKEFRLTDDNDVRFWMPLTNGDAGNMIEDIVLLDDKKTLRIAFQDNTYIDLDLSDNYSKGLVGHQFLKVTNNDFVSGSTVGIGGTISGSSITLDYSGGLMMTNNLIVVEISDIDIIDNYYMILPNSDETTAGVRLTVYLKQFDASEYGFYIQSTHADNRNRILGKNLETYVTDNGYYLPLNFMETADLIWDGNDWLVINYIKEEYVSALADPVNL